MKYISNSTNETERIASDIAKTFSRGDIITLDGDLGAGKTAFVRGFARGLGILDHVVSPTFTIVNEYRSGSVTLFHFDVYRISSPDEMYDIGWDDYLASDGIVIVEWAVNIKDILDCNYTEINIIKNLDISEDYREISVRRISKL